MRSKTASAMSHRDRFGVGTALICAGSITILAGCRQSPPESPSAPTTAAAPSPAPPRTTPAPSPSTTERPVAIPQPVSAETPPRTSPNAVLPALSPADGKDAPGAPDCLPRSGQVGRWVKTEPVRVLAPNALAEVVPLSDASRFAHFRLVSGVVCAYSLPRDAGDGMPVQARVLLIEAETVSDAYGLLTCQSSSSHTAAFGDETRIEEALGLHLHCRQGAYYIRISSEPASLAHLTELQPLLAHIVARLEGGGEPELLSALPDDGSGTSRRWLVRHLASVSPRMLGAAVPPDIGKVGELLGLNRETLMAIAAYELPQAQRPNIVWLVRYPSETAASTAYQEYQAFLAQAVGVEWESTGLLRPHGVFLIGTWTMEEESMQYMLPQIERRLPRP